MNQPNRQLATIGELTVDDVIIEDQGADWKQAGGGGLYSAVGARVWSPEVALSSVVGQDYPDHLLQQLQAAGIDMQGVATTPAVPSIGLWLLYEEDGTRRQVEKKRGGTFASIDAQRPSPYATGLDPVGVHIAPQSSQGQLRALDDLDGRPVVRTLDLLIEPQIDLEPYLSGRVFEGIDAFLPSEQEVIDVWGHKDIRQLAEWLTQHGVTPHLVIKRGAQGVDLLVDGTVTRIPSVVENLLDPTGAGDAFCGGFLSGLVETGDPVEAAIRGVVSSSFVCETRGALDAIKVADRDAAERRALVARNMMKEDK